MTRASDYANTFAPAIQQAVEAVGKEKEQIKNEIEQLQSQRDQIERDLAELQRRIESMDHDVAIGLTHAVRSAGLKVNLATPVNGKASTSSSHSNQALTDEVVSKVVAAIPESKSHAVTIGALRKEIKISDTKVLSSALKRLIAQKKVKTVGERRAKRYFSGPVTLTQGQKKS